MSLNVQIVAVGGDQVCDMFAETDWTVGKLKDCIEAVSGIPVRKQCLALDGDILDNNGLLGDYLSAGDACITLIRQRACNDEAEEWLCRVEDDWQTLRTAPRHIKTDLDVILAAVQQAPHAINIVLCLIHRDRILRENANVFEYLANHEQGHKRDWEMVRIAMEHNVHLLRYASAEMKNDRTFVFNAVQTDGESLRYASKQLRDDRYIVHAAVRQNGKALRYASDICRSDRKIVLAAMKQDITAANFALRFDKETLAQLVYISQRVEDDLEEKGKKRKPSKNERDAVSR